MRLSPTVRSLSRMIVLGGVLWGLAGCSSSAPTPDLSRLYDRAAQYHGVERDPVILIPGLLGSKLQHVSSDTTVWGAFTGKHADPETPRGARLVALPMRRGVPLSALRDSVRPAGALEQVETNVLGLPVALDAYISILRSLGIGGYRDENVQFKNVDYGSDHFTCFQFDYDWRRDNVENARRLHAFIQKKRAYVQRRYAKRFGVENYDVEFDLVAHSMGGLVARYYLRYGTADVPKDARPADVTWAGARHVDQAVLVAPPNAGSAHALDQLVHGRDFGRFAPMYAPALLGTMPSLYQLLPRPRHGALRTAADTSVVVDSLYDPAFWRRMEWGLMDPDQADVLRTLLPNVESAAVRRRIAYDHLQTSLRRARRFHAALDVPASPPEGLDLLLMAGDAEPTLARMAVDRSTGTLTELGTAPGDGTVLRSSALMDERVGGPWAPTLQSPIEWSQVTFLFESHVEMTADPMFTDNLLYHLLVEPGDPSGG
ncbi:MAG: esterase/lipase family protein [Salinibacter sp.]